MRISVVRPPEIRVFVAGDAELGLTAQALSGPRTGSIALWVGNNSPGRLAGVVDTAFGDFPAGVLEELEVPVPLVRAAPCSPALTGTPGPC